jgi:hypothetical protein
MSRAALYIAVAALALGGAPLSAQSRPAVPTDKQVNKLPRQKLAGPRFGFTTFTGETAKAREAADLQPMMTQFGWQLETQVVSLESRAQALMEWVFLVGGVEQSELNLSLAWMAGYRMENGVEIGVGPNVSWNKDTENYTSSMIVAGGATLGNNDIRIPVNVAVGMAKGGPRITTLLGWVIG